MKSITGIRFHHVDFTRWNYDAVSDGEAEFTVVDETSALDVLTLYPDLKIAFALPGSDAYGFAVMPGSDLRQSLNQYINEMRSSSQLEKIVREYMKKLNAAPERE
jgi:ABC-type amino acid transport substrate-binding protein